MLLAAMFASYKAGKLTLAGTLTGGLIATFIYIYGAGFTGIGMLGAHFLHYRYCRHIMDKKAYRYMLTADICPPR
jgi:hypothetical protein